MTNKEMEQILESIHTDTDIITNAPLIYISDDTRCKSALEKVIRFGNLSVPTLESMKNKLRQTMTNALDNNIPLTEETQNYLVNTDRLLQSKIISQIDNEDKINGKLGLLEMYSSDYVFSDKFQIATESMNYGSENQTSQALSQVLNHDKITGKAILEVCCNVFNDPRVSSDDIIELRDILKDRVGNTLDYEMKREEYHDLPTIHTLDCCRDILNYFYEDNKEKIDQINDVLDDVEYSISDKVRDFLSNERIRISNNMKDCDDVTIKEEFNANPFNSIYQMTPFPVGSRTVARTVDDCLNADTDEELIESLNNFGKLMSVCEMFGEDILLESQDSLLNKMKRGSKKGKDKLIHNVKKIGDKLHGAAVTAKKTIDPMARFIEDTGDKMAKKDMEDRKNSVKTLGSKGQVLKITKWIKDVGIRAVIGGTCGMFGFSIGTVIAGISLVGYIINNASLDHAARQQVLRELENELDIVNEKIEDSRGDDKKDNKYQLMRIKSKLEKELERVKRHQKY